MIAGSPDTVAYLFKRYERIADTHALLPPATATVEEIRETIDNVGATIA